MGLKVIFSRPGLYNSLLKMAPVVNHMPRFMIYNGLNDWGKGRELPRFAPESFTSLWKKGKVQPSAKRAKEEPTNQKCIL